MCTEKIVFRSYVMFCALHKFLLLEKKCYCEMWFLLPPNFFFSVLFIYLFVWLISSILQFVHQRIVKLNFSELKVRTLASAHFSTLLCAFTLDKSYSFSLEQSHIFACSLRTTDIMMQTCTPAAWIAIFYTIKNRIAALCVSIRILHI